MSCTDPILSFEALIQRAVGYSEGCATVRYAEASEESALTCDLAELSDLMLLAMAFDTTSNLFRISITPVTAAELCSAYSLRMECAGITASQAFREAITTDGAVATIRVLHVVDWSSECPSECQEQRLEEFIGSTVVTDGTTTYILAVDPAGRGDDITCTSAQVGAQTFALSSITEVGSCGMRGWMITEEELEGGAFDADGFSNGFNI